MQPQFFATLLRAAFDAIRIFAGPNPAICARLLDSLAELALLRTEPDDRKLLRVQAEVIRRAAERSLIEPEDMAYVEARYGRMVQQLTGEPAAKRR